jgi:hypothetical protein
MTAQSILNREANPLATPFHFAGIVADFIHLADICHSCFIKDLVAARPSGGRGAEVRGEKRVLAVTISFRS